MGTEHRLPWVGAWPPIAVRGSRRARGSDRLRWFTLLELVVAVAILLLIVSLLVTSVGACIQSWQRIRAEESHFSRVMALDRTLDAVLSNAVPFTWPNQDRKAVCLFRGEPDFLQLTYRHRLNNLADGSLRFMALWVENDQLLAAYAERPFVDEDDFNTNARVSVLAEGVASIRFRYADWRQEGDVQWLEEWTAEDDERLEIPIAVLVTVAWSDGRHDPEVWLRRTAGNGLYERWGNWLPRHQKETPR